ncbi:MAG: B12-binding domain-containing radical SAM protein, partial [Planctomycetota bacterium]
MTRTLNILLIHPAWAGLSYRRRIKVNERKIHPLSLGVVAASSGDHNVTIVDEAIESIPLDVRAYDVVGITVNTYTARRAYEIADSLRSKGKVVIFGGVHPSLMPE